MRSLPDRYYDEEYEDDVLSDTDEMRNNWPNASDFDDAPVQSDGNAGRDIEEVVV